MTWLSKCCEINTASYQPGGVNDRESHQPMWESDNGHLSMTQWPKTEVTMVNNAWNINEETQCEEEEKLMAASTMWPGIGVMASADRLWPSDEVMKASHVRRRPADRRPDVFCQWYWLTVKPDIKWKCNDDRLSEEWLKYSNWKYNPNDY